MRGEPAQEVFCRQKRSSMPFEEYLRQYVGRTRGLAWQEPYKGDLFK